MLKRLLEIDKKLLIIIGLFIGILVSFGSVKALEYMDSPEFCATCHLMGGVTESFLDSTHAGIECNDCHLPNENIAGKLIYKGKVGMGHVYYNSIGTDKIPEVVHAKENTLETIQANCISCHEATLSNVSHDSKDRCISCHQSVPHGNTHFKTEEFDKRAKSGSLLENKGGFY